MFKKNIIILSFFLFVHTLQSKSINTDPSHNEKTDITIDLNILFDKYYILSSDRKQQLMIANRYLTLAKKSKAPKYLITGYTLIANSLDFKKGKIFIDSLNTIECKNDENCTLLKLSNRGAFFYQNRYYREALDEYIKANDYFRKLKLKTTDLHIGIKDAIARIKNIQGRTNEALKIYLENEKYLKKTIGTTNENLYTDCLFSITECYNKLQLTNENEKIIAKGLALTKSNNDHNSHNYFVFAKAKNNYNLKQYREALTQFYTILPVFSKNDDYINYAECCFYIGKINEFSNNKKLAINYYIKVDSILNQKKYAYSELKNIYPILIKYFEKNRNFNTSYYFSKQLIKADSILQRNYEYIVDKTHTKFDIPEMEEKKEKEFSKIKISLTTIIICILFITSVLAYIFNEHRKKKKTQLIEQYRKFQKLLSEKETLENKLDSLEHLKVATVEKNKRSETILELKDKSLLDELLIKNLLEGLSLFEENHCYTNPECSLDSLANDLKTNTTYLSHVINKYKKTNFSNYIHDLRINYFIQLLKKDKKFQNYSIQALAQEIGYKNHSTFTRIFNTKAGMTPSMYIKAYKEDKLLDNL
ncbi:helix-turn-helix domain-containing protein [Flavobacterium davisii]|uniref:Helix-turn-helix transcriptional regulator n=1 Tax=Flavobacterium columnare TaxID=996 RepID=A0A8G0KV30_9FLAO|nr:helix-turn-helix transcriptional regulator [Flavobacterium davisii]QYS88992.1 helix-turn-helix transcriptional regulator [Flavobacterium davisii]